MRRRSARLSSAGVSDSLDLSESFSTRFSLPSFLKQVDSLTDDQRKAIERTGFGNLLRVPNQTLNKNLLVELMRRWSIDKHAFILPAGEIGINLMDVALILGLRVVGAPVIFNADQPFIVLEKIYGADIRNRKITVSSLKSRLNSLEEICDDDFIRTFLLYAFGTFLFPNANGKVDSRFLHFLKNIDGIGDFAWGVAVVEDVLMWLDKRKEMTVQYVGSCLAFLQIWSFEHIDIARPPLFDSSVTFPRICLWDKSNSHNRQQLSAKFNDLVDLQVTWELQPTSLESKIDIIKELLEAQNNLEEHSKSENSSMDLPIVTGINFGNILKKMDKQVIEVETESETSSTNEVQNNRQGNLDNLTQNVPEVITKGINFETRMDKQVIEVETESETSFISEGQNDQECNVNNLTQNFPEVTEGIDFETRLTITDKQVIEVETESETSSISESQNDQRDNWDKQVINLETESETSSISEGQSDRPGNLVNMTQNVPEVITDTIECPSTPRCISKMKEQENVVAPSRHESTIIVTENEDLRTRVQRPEEKIMELEEELDKLRKENGLLRNQLLSSSQLEEKNAVLKREIDALRRENLHIRLSSNGFAVQLDKILLGEICEDINVNEESHSTQD